MLLLSKKFSPANGLDKLRLALRDHLRLCLLVRYNAALPEGQGSRSGWNDDFPGNGFTDR